jgi:hypothetical protein
MYEGRGDDDGGGCSSIDGTLVCLAVFQDLPVPFGRDTVARSC